MLYAGAGHAGRGENGAEGITDQMSKVHIIMYHYVRDLKNSRYPGIKGLDYELFKQQIAFLKEHFTFVTMEDVMEACNSENGTLPENAVLLTFDDGYIDNFTAVFPILKENKIQGSFFIPGKTFTENVLLDVNKIHFTLASADVHSLVKDIYALLDRYRRDGMETEIPSNEELFEKYAAASRFDNKETIFVKRILQTAIPEKIRNQISSELFQKYVGLPEDVFARELYMNRDQIRCMKREGMFIGLHGYDHYWLGNLAEQEMKADIDKALEVMGEFVDGDNWVLNYPYGSYNPQVLQYIASRGCKAGMVTKVAVADTDVHGRFELPRLDCNDFPPKSSNYLNIQ